MNMEEVLACRVCLVTDVKLYDIHEYGLAECFHNATGYMVCASDGLPQHLCCYCAASLQKCTGFRHKYLQTQCLLTVMLQSHQMTQRHLRKIDREAKKLSLALSVHHNLTTIDYIHDDEVIKTETAEDNTFEDFQIKLALKSEDEDFPFLDSPGFVAEDDEPIAKRFKKEKSVKTQKVKPKKKKKDILGVKDIQRKSEDANIELLLLSRKEQLAEIEGRKESTNYISALFKCELCFKGFLQESTYKNHMSMHDPSVGPHKCDVCSVYCANERRLRAHKKVSHERRYICKLCNNVATTSHYAREHQRWHNGVTYDCGKCGMSFRKSTSYLTHVRLQHPSSHVCDVCGDSFIGASGLNTHKLKAHRHQLTEQQDRPESYCVQCAVRFRSETALTRHRDTATAHTRAGALSKYCVTCGDSFPDEDSLFVHKKKHKQQVDKVKCKECGLVCVFTNYSAHYKKFHVKQGGPGGDKRVIVKNYVCEVCGKKCTSNATLAYHQRTHTGEKPFSCPACPKKFKVHQLMKIHYRTHTGEAPYMCSVCPKAFKHKAALNRHVRVHTGDKPYTCPYCGKSFSQSNSLKLHVNTVHLKLPAPYKRRAKLVE